MAQHLQGTQSSSATSVNSSSSNNISNNISNNTGAPQQTMPESSRAGARRLESSGGGTDEAADARTPGKRSTVAPDIEE